MGSNSKTQSTDDVGSDFSEPFKSDIFTVYIGSEKAPYHLHQSVLRRRSPYFKSLLAFEGSEAASSSVHLNTGVDTVQGFDMVVSYLYHDSYTPPSYLSDAWTTHTHAEVYVLAERLLMPELQALALEHMARNLARLYGTRTLTHYSAKDDSWREHAVPAMDAECVVQLVQTVYAHTRETDDALTKAKSPSEPAPPAAAPATTAKAKSPPETAPPAAVPAPQDPMRRLLARYCASNLSSLKKSPALHQLLRTHPDFAEALILELPERSERITNNEVASLLTVLQK